MGLSGGVSAERVSDDTYRIKARGNEFTPKSKIEDFVLLKAAELTLQSGGTHFALSNNRDTSTATVVNQPVTVTQYGSHSVVSQPPPVTFYQPGQDTFVKIVTIPRDQQTPSGYYSAEEVSKYTGARLRKK